LVSFPCDSVVRQRWKGCQMVRNEHRHRRPKTRGMLARRRESRPGNDCQGEFGRIHSRSPMPSCRTDRQRMLLQRHIDRSQWFENPAGNCTEPSIQLQRPVSRHSSGARRRTLHCGGAPQDTSDRVGRGVRHTLGRAWMAHSFVGARPEGLLVDPDRGLERPANGHVRDLLVRAAHSNRAGSKTNRADHASRGGCD